MKNYFDTLLTQLKSAEELDEENFSKSVKLLSGGKRMAGAKCAWCYEDDFAFWKEDSLHGRKVPHPMHWFYGGILIPTPNYEMRGEIDYENCVVIVTEYPVEKCYVECDWTPLMTILTTPSIHRFHIMEIIRANKLLPL